MTTTAPLDAPYYTKTRDGRRVHVCAMPGHDRYWLNVGAALWVCAACHPPLPGESVALARVGEFTEGAKRSEVNYD